MSQENGVVLVPMPQEVVELIKRLSAAAGMQPAEFVGEHLPYLLHMAEYLLSLRTSAGKDVPGYL